MEKVLLKKGHENNFNTIRLVAALMVMAGHMGILIGKGAPIFLSQSAQTIGVITFFTIGGYFVAQSWTKDPDIVRYSVKRIFRIFPPLIVFVLLLTFVVGPLLSTLTWKEYFASPVTYSYLYNILLRIHYFLPGVFANNPYPNAVNGSLWSLPVEVFMYILLPIVIELTSLRKKRKLSKIIFLFITIIVCFVRLVQVLLYPQMRIVIYDVDLASALRLIPFYFIGALYSFPEVKKLCNIQIASILIIAYSFFRFGATTSELATFIIYPYFVFSLAFDSPPFFANKFKNLEISYGLFLYGFFVQQMTIYLVGKTTISLDHNMYFILCTAITAIVAYLSYLFIEKPSINLSKYLLKKYADRQPAFNKNA